MLAFLTVSCASQLPICRRLKASERSRQKSRRRAREALDSLAEDPRDAARWGRFGMICEANGIIEPARNAYAMATTFGERRSRSGGIALRSSRRAPAGSTRRSTRCATRPTRTRPTRPLTGGWGCGSSIATTPMRPSARSSARAKSIRATCRRQSAWRASTCSDRRISRPPDVLERALADHPAIATRCSCSARPTAASAATRKPTSRSPSARWANRRGPIRGPTR